MLDSVRIISIILLSLIWVGVYPEKAASETLNRVVAIVNDEIVTLYELNNKFKELTGFTPNDMRRRDESGFQDVRRNVLNLLIDEKIAKGKIQELGIQVSQEQTDATIEKIKNDNQWTQEDLLAKIEREGLTFEQYIENIRQELERMKLINMEVNSKIVIREETMRQYYEEHKEDFTTHEEITLASIVLFLKDPQRQDGIPDVKKKGNDILAKLRNGEEFGEVAKKFSEGPGAEEGGLLGTFRTDQLDPTLRTILEAIPEGEFSDLIVRPNGIQIIKVIKRKEGESKGLEDVTDAVYGILYRQEVNKRYSTWIKKLRESAYTKIIL